jgi:hypothetical protein
MNGALHGATAVYPGRLGRWRTLADKPFPYMPLPKGINNPAVRAAWLTSRRGTVQAFDRLVDAGATTTAAARSLGVTVAGVKSMRRSIESLEEGLPMGRGTSTQIDLGLALLSCLIKPGERLTSEDIAAWCGCTKSVIQRLEHRAMRKLRQRLVESVLEPDLAGELQTLIARSHQPT